MEERCAPAARAGGAARLHGRVRDREIVRPPSHVPEVLQWPDGPDAPTMNVVEEALVAVRRHAMAVAKNFDGHGIARQPTERMADLCGHLIEHAADYRPF